METGNLKLVTGWDQRWTSSRGIKKNRCIDVQEVVRGPFSSPRLLKAQPFVAVTSSYQRETRNVGKCDYDSRHGIPDPWREYLAVKGFCGTIEERVLIRNLVPSCVRCLATDRLWNDAGLPFVQGIPDPWKSKEHVRSTYPRDKCVRRRICSRRNISTQAACMYDGDDEAEVERSWSCRSNKDRIRSRREHHKEMRGYMDIIKQGHERAVRVCKSNKRTMETERENEKYRNAIYVSKKPVVIENDVKHCAKKKVKTIDEKNHEKTVKIVKEKLETNKPMKLNHAVQTNLTLKDQINEVRDLFTVNDLQAYHQTIPHVVCCCCILRNHLNMNVQGCLNLLNTLQESHLSGHVLCKECDNLRSSKKSASRPETITYCTPDTKRCPTGKQKSKCTKFKFSSCFRKKRQPICGRKKNPCCVETNGTILPNRELKLLCCRCNSPYLKIGSAQTRDKSISRDTCSCSLKNERNGKRDGVRKYSSARERRNIVRCGKKHGCTCAEKKRNGLKRDLEQITHATRVKWENEIMKGNREMRKENVDSGKLITKNKNVENYEQLQTDIQCKTQRMIRDTVLNEKIESATNIDRYGQRIRNCKMERVKRVKNEKVKSDLSSDSVGKIEKEVKCAAIIHDNVKFHVLDQSTSKSDGSVLCSVSDSGDFADVSDNIPNINFHFKTCDYTVTSSTFMQRLNETILTKNSQSCKPRRCRYKTSDTTIVKSDRENFRMENETANKG